MSAMHNIIRDNDKMLKTSEECIYMLETALAALERGKTDVVKERLEYVISKLQSNLK